MKSRYLLLAAALPLTLLAAEPPMPPSPQKPPTPMSPVSQPISKHVMYDTAQLQWQDGPPALPQGAQMTVLSGDPGQAGTFVIRLKAPPGYKVPTHWHPTDEQVTVLEGDFTLQMDEHGPGAHAHTFGPGGYALMPAKMHHAASTQDGATVQVSGMGPFEINYIDPKDDPRLRMPAKQK